MLTILTGVQSTDTSGLVPMPSPLVSSRLLSFCNRIYLITDLLAVFFFFFIPEMKGRSLEELDEMFQNRVSVRNFPKYHCVSSERAREIAAKDVAELPEEKNVVVTQAEVA